MGSRKIPGSFTVTADELTIRCGELSTSLMEMRRSGALSDVTLVCDGEEIKAHRVILAAQSQYFLVMFTAPFVEQTKQTIPIHSVDSETLNVLVDFTYSGKIDLTERNVQRILVAASMFQMQTVVNSGCEFLEAQLHPSNVLGIHTFAKHQGFSQLVKIADDFRRAYFQDVIYQEEFRRLEVDELSALIASPRLTIRTEDQVLHAVLDWIHADRAVRKDFLAQLILHVRLPLVKRDLLYTNELLRNDLTCKTFRDNDDSPNVLTFPRKSAGQPQHIIVFCGDALTTDVYVFDVVDEMWGTLPPLPIHQRRTRAQIVTHHERLFVIGGYCGMSLKGVQVFDFSTRRWTKTSPMINKRSSFAAVCFQNKIVAIGGISNNTVRSVECFDIASQRWTVLPPLREERAFHGAGVLRGTIYVVGGVNSLFMPLNTAEYYDTVLRHWVRTSNMNRPRSGLAVAVFNDRLYAIGGSDRFSSFSSVEVFNPDTNTWTEVCPMHKRRRVPGVVIHNNRLVVIGGDENSSPHTTVEVYDPGRNRWWLLVTPDSLQWGSCVGQYNLQISVSKKQKKVSQFT